MKRKKKIHNIRHLLLIFFAMMIMVFFISERWNTTSVASTPIFSTPYMRFIAPVSKYKVGQIIPVDVYLNTGGVSTVEVVIEMKYDPSFVSIAPIDIINAGVYPIINIESVSSGTVIFSLFTDMATGYSSVSLGKESAIAHLKFRAVQAAPDGTKIEDGLSGIYTSRMSPEEPLPNILSHVEHATIFIDQL